MEERGVLRRPAEPGSRIAATRVSARLQPLVGSPRAVRGRVLSVHRHAVNLEFRGRLVTVAGEGAGGLPSGVLVPGPFDPLAGAVRPGSRCEARAGRLTLEPGLEIDVRGARRWSPRLSRLGRPADLGARLAAGRSVAGGQAPGLAPFPTSSALVHDLGRAIGSRRTGAAGRAGERLIGLGAGLTPAGDDLLVGLTAALVALGDGRGPTLAVQFAALAAGRTTRVAEEMHRAAAVGAYAERVHDALRAILVGPVGELADALRRASAWGATSGMDVLAGICLALAATAEPRMAVA